jgi:hypothetical protein
MSILAWIEAVVHMTLDVRKPATETYGMTSLPLIPMMNPRTITA